MVLFFWWAGFGFHFGLFFSLYVGFLFFTLISFMCKISEAVSKQISSVSLSKNVVLPFWEILYLTNA